MNQVAQVFFFKCYKKETWIMMGIHAVKNKTKGIKGGLSLL